ncbi:CMGC family protein kinase [Trichomonas vaginalis G3]|uniref:CMGC family protein kinase n=1 Tax=Trichomonas vaginalis (strain ATCC PRA-98 / G3) TaxID=412133 RepID=A2DMG0_TRIV3|nr:protein kinase superfamily [Trichomonas vaginalis G3]EAY18387.1 CMGC family protein kinase [Trichomonas vaginalis G3]KAI5530343.1 protein kinase superfamily [Trichomonas vaginalis G3]|eukprot:XP_001579373.1 CMGC family protein kinase [Trichomonas vaginalis G3]
MEKFVCNRFNRKKKLGRGGFGIVYIAEDTVTKETLALKKIMVRSPKDGIEYHAIQEIRQLNELQHPNIVKFNGVFTHKFTLYLSTEYLPYELIHLFNKYPDHKLPINIVKCVMKGVLQALSYMHNSKIMHRDIKPDNVLFDKNGVPKLIDFGLSCDFPSDFGPMICQATTLNYRAPELLFSQNNYGSEIDMWSTGAMFAELLLGKPIFDAPNDIHLLSQIAKTLGTIEWSGCEKIRAYMKFSAPEGFSISTFDDKFKEFGNDALSLLKSLLVLDPSKRITADEALKHPFLSDAPDFISFE